MKVKIGKYPAHLTCNIHKDYMVKKHGFNYPPKKDWSRFEKNMELIVQELSKK